MSNEVRSLAPKVLWNHFEDLNAVPRPSKKEERVIQFIMDFGKNLGLHTERDEIGNVLIKKPATPGFENKMGVVLQSHLDMVHQKNSDTDFDFLTQGIQSYIDGDWVKAKGTTLGADNGIGVASAMAVLSSTDIEHGPIESIFTIDEETGMTGAEALTPNWVEGDILLNMDTEDEGELCIGCAGGVDTTVNFQYHIEDPTGTAFNINLTGLFGGHSGCDIHLQRGNSNKLMARLLLKLYNECNIQVSRFEGGSLRNAIPREAFATIVIPDGNIAKAHEIVNHLTAVYKSEFYKTDPNLKLEMVATEKPKDVATGADASKILNAIHAVRNGMYRMSNDFEDLVETSTNTSRVVMEDGHLKIDFLTRSSVDEAKWDLASQIESTFKLIGAEVEHAGSYPGWEPNPDSEILKVMRGIHEDYFKEKPIVNAVHAGLECGIISRTQPKLDMISFGPTIKNPHSPDEKCHIGTVERFWGYLKKVLVEVPNKN